MAYEQLFGRLRDEVDPLLGQVAETRVWIDEWQEIGYVEARASA